MENTGGANKPNSITGKRVLIIEDEIFVALDLQLELENAGVKVIGPVGTLEEAIAIATREEIDIAVVDVDLHGKQSYPAADILRKKGTPFVWHTGVINRDTFLQTYPDVPVIEKPARPSDIIEMLAKLTTDHA